MSNDTTLLNHRSGLGVEAASPRSLEIDDSWLEDSLLIPEDYLSSENATSCFDGVDTGMETLDVAHRGETDDTYDTFDFSPCLPGCMPDCNPNSSMSSMWTSIPPDALYQGDHSGSGSETSTTTDKGPRSSTSYLPLSVKATSCSAPRDTWDHRFDHAELQSPPTSRRSSTTDGSGVLTHVDIGTHAPVSYRRYSYDTERHSDQVPSEPTLFSPVMRRRPPALDMSLALAASPKSLPLSARPPSVDSYSQMFLDSNLHQVTPPQSANRASYHGRLRSVSKMPLSEMYRKMGLQFDHAEGARREELIIRKVQDEGFEVGQKTWIRDTAESERKRIILSIQKAYSSWEYPAELFEAIVRRGTYARMQSNLRRRRRQRKQHREVKD